MALAEYWVTIMVPETDAPALENAAAVEHDDRVGGVIWQEPSRGSAMVAFQIRAPEESGARDMTVFNEVRDAYRKLRRNAGLDPDEAPGTIASTLLRVLPETSPLPPPATQKPASLLHERLLLQARTLYAHSHGELGQYGHTIMVASTACEVAITRAMRRLMAAKVRDLLPALEGLIGNRFSLSDKRMVRLWDALADDQITTTGFWPGYNALQSRRQAVAHQGESASRAEAEEAVGIAQNLCEHVTRLAP